MVHYTCADADADALRQWGPTVVNCNAGDEPYTATSETSGISLDLTALNTRWIVGDKRMAIEFDIKRQQMAEEFAFRRQELGMEALLEEKKMEAGSRDGQGNIDVSD